MNNAEIRDALSVLQEMEFYLEEEYMNNGGEVTENTERQEAQIEAIRTLLTTEGVDSLGRWLKRQEDTKESLKAEKAKIDRLMKKADSTIEFIKSQITMLLKQTGQEKVKGTLYSFSLSQKNKTSVNKAVLEEMFLEAVEKKLRGGKNPVIPQDVTITLGASIKAVPEDTELPAYYVKETGDTTRFVKPRTPKED